MENMRKERIIKAAQDVFSDKGLENTSISEIAKTAGVVDSILYHYFKNKEDVLFCALSEKMTVVTKDVKLHLEGIEDPVSKLRKMIWFHLYINDLSPSDTRVIKSLLFECRSNKNFYLHEGYRKLRDYTGIMMRILQQGVDMNVFRTDLDVHLARDLIFGLLDEEALSCFYFSEIEESLPDFDDIMDLVLAMIMKKDGNSETTSSVDENNKREKILSAAQEVFAEKGYHGATMSEVAVSSGVAEGTVYTYFGNKKELLFSIPARRFAHLKVEMEQIFEVRDPLRKLRRIIRYHFSSFLADRSFVKVFLLDNKLNREFYLSSAHAEFLDYLSILNSVIEEGKEKGVFRKRIKSRLFRSLFVGGFSHLATKWLVLEKAKGIDLMEEIECFVELLCRSILIK